MGVQVVEAGAELIDDGVEGRENLVANVVLAQVFPEVFDRIQFRAVSGQGE